MSSTPAPAPGLAAVHFIEPIRPGKYDLGQMLAAITAENLHPEAEFGVPQGKEAL